MHLFKNKSYTCGSKRKAIISLTMNYTSGQTSQKQNEVINKQAQIISDQYEASKPHLKSNSSILEVFPVENQEDSYSVDSI